MTQVTVGAAKRTCKLNSGLNWVSARMMARVTQARPKVESQRKQRAPEQFRPGEFRR